MDTASSEVLSESSSDKTVKPVQQPQPINARESENFPETYVETENQVASKANAAGTPSVNASNDVLHISLEVVAITLLNRARILLMLKNRSGARQCFEDALECSRFSHNDGLQQKCSEWVQQFHDGSGVCDPLIARTGAESDLELMLRLATKYNFEWDYWIVNQAVAASRPLSTPPATLLPTAAQPGDNHTPASSSLPPMKVDLMVADIRDASSRRRRLPERRPLSLAQHSRPTPVKEQVVSASEYKAPSGELKNVQESSLLKRRGDHPRSSQARASPPTPTHQPRRLALGENNKTMVDPLPQPRTSLDLHQNLLLESGNAGSLLSTDTPSLTKLAETISANPSPQSDSSAETAVHRRPSILHSHTPPSLAIQTSGSYAAGAPDSTAPHNHSPLREAFVPEPDPVDDVDPAPRASVQPSDNSDASDKILNGEDDRSVGHGSDEINDHRVKDSATITPNPDLTNEITSPDPLDHKDSDETVTEQGRPESAIIMESESNSSRQDMTRAKRNGAIATYRIKQKIARLQAEKQKKSEESGQSEELVQVPERHHPTKDADELTSTTGASITPNHDPLAFDRIPKEEAYDFAHKNNSEGHRTASDQVEAALSDLVKHKILDPSEKYCNIDPDEIMTEQDRLDAERVINVALHETILNIAPDIVMDEYAKYQLKMDIAMPKASPGWHQQLALNKDELRKKLHTSPGKRQDTGTKETDQDDVD